VIRSDDGGDVVAVWLSETVLKQEFARIRPNIGGVPPFLAERDGMRSPLVCRPQNPEPGGRQAFEQPRRR
jgi:hypothetical protein